ncbi:MAG: hypothetical protein IJ901_00050 [Bacteroidaceae bacterium]|nr:hypothetical protein [Bacteroidaceae bacterium]
MKRTFLSLSMMLMAFMANAQQVVNVEFLDGDLDNDNKITTNDVTGMIDTYLTNEEPRKTVSVTVDNSELEEKIAKNTEWIDYMLKNQYFGLTEDEVQKMIEDYAAAHPGLTCDDVETLIAAYLAKNPQGLTKDDVQTIITEWIYNYQILDKGQVDALIEAAITKTLAGYALKSDIPTQAYIEDLINKAISAYDTTQQQTINELKATIDELKKEIQELKNAIK